MVCGKAPSIQQNASSLRFATGSRLRLPFLFLPPTCGFGFQSRLPIPPPLRLLLLPRILSPFLSPFWQSDIFTLNDIYHDDRMEWNGMEWKPITALVVPFASWDAFRRASGATYEIQGISCGQRGWWQQRPLVWQVTDSRRCLSRIQGHVTDRDRDRKPICSIVPVAFLFMTLRDQTANIAM